MEGCKKKLQSTFNGNKGQNLKKTENVFGFLADFSILIAVNSMAERIAKKLALKLTFLSQQRWCFTSKVDTVGQWCRCACLAVNYLARTEFTIAIIHLIEKKLMPPNYKSLKKVFFFFFFAGRAKRAQPKGGALFFFSRVIFFISCFTEKCRG